MIYNIPEVGVLELDTIVLDLNGTLSVQGIIAKGVKQKLISLKNAGFSIYLLTGDQRGTAGELCKDLGIELCIAKNAQDKASFIKTLGREKVVAIGNARIDIGMFQLASLSIGTLQSEGIHTEILQHIDVLIPSIQDALELLLDADILSATLRK